MLRRRVGLVLAAWCLLGTVANAAPPPTEVNVVLSATGTGAFLGTHETAALNILETTVNAHGGVQGHPLHFVFSDDQTSPQAAVQLTSGLVAKKVQAILGSSLASTCSAMASLVETSGPVQYCLSPIIRGKPGSYVYSASAGSDSIAAVIARFFRLHGWTHIALITSTDASGSDFEKQFDNALLLGENKSIQLVDREHFNGSDLTVTAQMARIKAANPQAIVTFATGTPLGTLLHGFHDADIDLPISASGGNMIYDQLNGYTDFMPHHLFFAATRGVVPDANLRPGPIRDAEQVYFRAFKAAHVQPDFASSLVWDPAMILVAGLRQIGPGATAEQLQAFIQGLHSWAGIDGIYDFRDKSQRGIGQGSMVIYHWNTTNRTLEVVSHPAGELK